MGAAGWREAVALALGGGLLAQGKVQPEVGPDVLGAGAQRPPIPSCQSCPGVGPLHKSTSNGKSLPPKLTLGIILFNPLYQISD